MSEKEKEIEEEEEIVDHWSHEHPLTLVETRRGDKCYSCGRQFSSGEEGYGCSKKCGYKVLLHEECVGLSRKIRHAVHPQHILVISQELDNGLIYEDCGSCRGYTGSLCCYKCTSTGCEFWMHIRCAQDSGVMDAAEDDEQSRAIKINHPSHPKHELRLVRRSCSFKCDACGTTRRGNSYICSAGCQYWIHERCASLPQTMKREDHHHSLSLSFHVPPQYMKFDYKCDVCNKYIMSKYWIYHCELCSYVVHLRCAFKKSPHTTRRVKGIMEFPISDVGEEQIGGLVKRHGGATPIPHHDVDYKFHNHKLKLVSSSSSSSSSSQEEKEDEENSDDDGEDDDYGKSLELICDGCITPIFQKQRSSSSSSSSFSSSSSSSSSKNYYYMSCSIGCKYYLHMACFHLPPHLPSIPLHQSGHHLILQSSDKLPSYDDWYCSVCTYSTNGLFYACAKCDDFKVDVKCASMPDTIYHAAHPQHPLYLLSQEDIQTRGYQPVCDACFCLNTLFDCYECTSCEFFVHVTCAGLPASTTSRRWDKHHPLPLMHDATLNHPGDFYCDECETEMNPKSWMYHCRSCDLSFHPTCFMTTSGWFRNIKFGQQYVIPGAHCHILTYQLLTTKRRCDVCSQDRHEEPGFHCASCNFFICFHSCGKRMLEDGDIEAVD